MNDREYETSDYDPDEKQVGLEEPLAAVTLCILLFALAVIVLP